MPETQTPAAESSPAPIAPSTFEVPSEGRSEWLKTGNFPAKADPPPAKESSAEGEKPEGKGAPAPEAGKEKQEQRRSNADTRLTELLEDLRRAGLSPSELKTYKREQSQQVEKPKAATEQTVNPAESKLQPPVKPKSEDFEGKSWSEYEAAKDKYFEDLADYKAAKSLADYRDQQRQEATTKELQTKLDGAKQRYGDEAVSTIGKASQEIFADAAIHGVVKTIMDDSPVLVDLLYVLGSKPEDMADFVKDARTNPGAAIRKLVLVEKLIQEELSGSAKSDDQADGTARGEDGKFKAPPEKKPTQAPPPPKEVSGRSSAPPDEVAEALKTGDARSAIDAMNRADLRRRKGL